MNDNLMCGGKDFLQRVEVCYDPESIIDILGLSVLDIIEAFSERIILNKDLFDACHDQHYAEMEEENDDLE